MNVRGDFLRSPLSNPIIPFKHFFLIVEKFKILIFNCFELLFVLFIFYEGYGEKQSGSELTQCMSRPSIKFNKFLNHYITLFFVRQANKVIFSLPFICGFLVQNFVPMKGKRIGMQKRICYVSHLGQKIFSILSN